MVSESALDCLLLGFLFVFGLSWIIAALYWLNCKLSPWKDTKTGMAAPHGRSLIFTALTSSVQHIKDATVCTNLLKVTILENVLDYYLLILLLEAKMP